MSVLNMCEYGVIGDAAMLQRNRGPAGRQHRMKTKAWSDAQLPEQARPSSTLTWRRRSCVCGHAAASWG